MPMSPRLLRPIASSLDPDAAVYLNAVAQADGQQLEPAVRKAINDFVRGCKQDGIWSAIKSSCLLAGPRTLAGINVPLVGPTPTFNAFTASEYDRETGLIGNGSTMFIDTGYNGNTPPQDSLSFGVYVHTATSASASYIGSGLVGTGSSNFGILTSPSGITNRNRNTTNDSIAGGLSSTGLIGSSRSSSSEFVFRLTGANTTYSRTSQTPANATFHVFKTNGSTTHGNGRLSFYWAGEALDLALLDSRISAYITAIGAAI